MKKNLILIVSALLLSLNPSNITYTEPLEKQEGSVSDITPGAYPLVKDSKIVKALDALINTDGEWARRAIAGHNNSKKPIKVIFKDLSSISNEFKDHDALGWKDENNNLLIFINKKHSNAPVEALGSLLSHESIHQDDQNSVKEETYGWTYEAEVWIQLKNKYPYLKTIPPGQDSLVDRENLMEMLFRKAGYSSKLIEQKVRSNNSYKSLPETSPGFGK
ncbi:MAG: hypothetical protein AB1782_00180 [Cyanobacteriota bacterium]